MQILQNDESAVHLTVQYRGSDLIVYNVAPSTGRKKE